MLKLVSKEFMDSLVVIGTMSKFQESRAMARTARTARISFPLGIVHTWR